LEEKRKAELLAKAQKEDERLKERDKAQREKIEALKK
jgi:hypothetical protein